jgi:hypothetical protein
MPRLAGYWPNLITNYLCALLYTGRNDFTHLPHDLFGLDNRAEKFSDPQTDQAPT